jgi:hypothetical protein
MGSEGIVDSGLPPRVPDGRFPSIVENIVTLIRVGADVRFSTSKRGKLTLLTSDEEGALFLAIWTGKWRSDVFSVSRELRAMWVEELENDRSFF